MWCAKKRGQVCLKDAHFCHTSLYCNGVIDFVQNISK